ncbi:MAG: CDP-alcohol phosphatidyltransferase family protein [Spirochaetales bacterium]|nr:CDP-alcohol phosphatidyltransferase family protein [Spirochaetales bacterium]
MSEANKKSIFNLANSLTVSRVILGFVFLALFLIRNMCSLDTQSALIINIIAFFVFVIAIITDALDGYVARKTGTVTDFGKHFDPLADSIFFVIVFGTFVYLGLMPWYLFLIVLTRECYMHIYLRPHLRRHGTMLPANIYGKTKTFCQCMFSLIILFMMILRQILILTNVIAADETIFQSVIGITAFVMFCIIAFLSAASLMIYIVQNAAKMKEIRRQNSGSSEEK